MAFLASGAFAQGAEKDPLERLIELTGRIDPYLQAIYRDHKDVARNVFAQAPDNKWVVQRKIIADVITTYGAPVLARAGDSAVISVMNNASALAGIVAEKYPEGCEYFFTGNMPNWADAVDVRNGRMTHLRAKTYAYQDGKFRAPVNLISSDEQYRIMTQYLGMTAEEVRKSGEAPIGVSDEDMCSLASKLNNVSALPKELRGDWGRALLARGQSVQKEPTKPAAGAKTASGALAQKAEPASFEKEMQILASVNPFVHAVMMDHEAEARQMFDEVEASGGKIDPRIGAARMLVKYGNPALSRASDTIAIDVLMKTGELNEALARYYPQGCKDFVGMRISQRAQAIPQVRERYWQYMEAKRLAYEDGKTRPPATGNLTEQEILKMITQHLGVTVEELGKLTKLSELSDEEACSITMRLNALDPIPEAQRGIWARIAMSGAG